MKGRVKMKKRNLFAGLLYIFGGILFLLAALLTDSVVDSMLVGFGAGALCGGLVMTGKYIYWTRPENRERYKEKLSRELIEIHDEMKITLRDKSGRYAYVLGLLVISIAILVFSVLGKLGIVDSQVIILFLGGYLLFQIAAGILIFRYLLKKY